LYKQQSPGIKSKGRGDLWLPTLIGLAGLLIALAGWGLLVADRRDELLESANEIAAETQDAIEKGLQVQFDTIQGLGTLWIDFDMQPSSEWQAAVEQHVDRIDGLASVEWLDLEDPGRSIEFGRERAPEEVQRDLEDARRFSGRTHLTGPERDASGMLGYRIFLPVEAARGGAGVLVARFHIEPFMESVLRARAQGYALSVTWDGEPIYSRGTPTADSWQDWWHAENEVELPVFGHWRVTHRPTPEFAAARLNPVPHYLLITGVLLSGVFAMVAHQFRVIGRQARFLEATNRALEERGQQLESEVAERTRDLEEAITELEAFNYSVSHDLRSPLGAILNFTAILEEDYVDRPLDAGGMANLGRIRRSARRAIALLEGLLQLSRAGRATLTFERIDMAALAKVAFAQVRAAQHDSDVEFIVGSLPDAVGDRALLCDAFANLFSNALKYSRGCEKRRITVNGRIEDDECVYEVTDTGQGFDMRFADKLFGLFERLHAADEIQGTGVGLAMVARIVKRHGGRVWAEGSPGRGACFSFAIPRSDGSETDSPRRTAS
jgi:two-component system sensor kinase